MNKLIFLVLMMINIDIFAHIVINDQAVQKIPIIENHEHMVDLSQYDFIHIGPSPEVANNQDYYWIRQSVADKLKTASQNLPKGYQLCLYEGHRSLTLQSYLFQSYYAKIKQRYPDLGKKELFKKTTQLISPITNYDNTPNIPPHSTGAAIDVYLLNDKGEPIDMGIHPKDWQQDITGEISITQSEHISKEAQAHRNIMSKALESAGFVNYPFEYWHWSYGDKYWAYIKQKPHAIYNVIKN